MTKEEVINKLNSLKQYYNDDYDDDEVYVGFDAEDNEAIDMAIKALEQTELTPSYNGVKSELDCVSREAVQDLIAKLLSDYLHDEDREKIENVNAEIGELPSVQPQPITLEKAIDYLHEIGWMQEHDKEMAQPRWTPCSERLPMAFEFVNCTCHSLIDDREDWVIETVYVPQPSNSPYSDWGNIPMLNSGDCKVVAWIHRDIPEPYKAESEDEE